MVYAAIQFTTFLLEVLIFSCFPFDLAENISLIYKAKADQEQRFLKYSDLELIFCSLG